MTNSLETTFTFRNMESTDSLREHAMDKLDKIGKYLLKPTNAHVIFNVEGARHIAEIAVNVRGARIVGVDSSNDMYVSVDRAVDKIKKQLIKDRDRLKNRR